MWLFIHSGSIYEITHKAELDTQFTSEVIHIGMNRNQPT